MARTIGLYSLEQKMEKAQYKVVKTKKKYEVAVAELGDLMNKCDALMRDELVLAIMKSNKSYYEILRLIQESNLDD